MTKEKQVTKIVMTNIKIMIKIGMIAYAIIEVKKSRLYMKTK